MKREKNMDKWMESYRVPATKYKEDAWLELKQKLETNKTKSITPVYRKNYFTVAASVLMAALLFTFLTDSVLNTKKHVAGTERQETIRLSDSSTITLNPLSGAKVNYSFITGKRKVKLIGEALFDVVPGKTFVVKFQGGKVNVLGTVFSVSAYKNSHPKVNCLEGSVMVRAGKEHVVLQPETGVHFVSGAGLVPETVNREEILEELNGNYNWNNISLKVVFEKLENYSGYTIEAPDVVKIRRFSGQMQMQELEKACEIISFALDLNFTVDQSTKTVRFEVVY